jgi:trimethylamine--corrinoid protein Co-methyltransferase
MSNLISGGLYRPLNEDQIRKIHSASLKTLEKIGMSFEPSLKTLLDSINQAGVVIDQDKHCVRFSPELVNEAISQTPEQVVLYSRDGKRDVDLQGDQVYFSTAGTAVNILDLETGVCRKSVLKDVYQIARLVDRLDNIDMFYRVVTPNDLPLDISDVNLLYATLKGTSKHIGMPVFVAENLPQVLDLAALVAGGMERLQAKPWLSMHATCAISPLQLDTKPVRIMEQAVKTGIPVSLSTAPMAGSTGPVTLAGTLTLMHAELLALMVLSQLIKPGAPVIYCATPVAADMATMNFLTGTVESAMMMAAAHQLARHIDVPNFISAGWVDAKLPDAQAGWEAAVNLVLAAMGGGNGVRHSAGILDSAMTVAMEQFVINNEIIGITRRLLKGIEVSEEHIAYDVIKSVGPGGQYITADHTLKHMREELSSGCRVTDRQSREIWEISGSPDARTTAQKIAQEILAEPEIPHIDPEIDKLVRTKYDIRL